MKLAGPVINPAPDPEGPVTALQFKNLNSRGGQMLKAAEKQIEPQTQALMNQSSGRATGAPPGLG